MKILPATFSIPPSCFFLVSMENELDRPAVARGKVILPYRYKEIWDGWRTQMLLEGCRASPSQDGAESAWRLLVSCREPMP